MSFGWKRFLQARGVPFRESGRFEILVRCPFCGEADPSEHLSISLRGRGWRCLRNPAQHHGKSYARALAGLLKCSVGTARELLGEAVTPLPAEDTFSQTWRKQLGLEPAKPKPQFLSLPPEAKPLAKIHSRLSHLFWDYLKGRGYTVPQIQWVAEQYQLHYALSGRCAYRIIVPAYDRRGVLMTWTARSILPDAEIRYMTLPGEEAFAPPGNLLLGLPLLFNAHNPKCLVITEGPFDSLAVSALGHRDGVYGTCLFGVQVSEAQAVLLDELSQRFDRVRLLIDPDARLRVLGFRDRLPRSCKITNLLEDLKDPGELPKFGAAGLDFVRALAI